MVKISTQAELDQAIQSGETKFEFIKESRFRIDVQVATWFDVKACLNAVVEARESSHVVAWESSRVEARESSHVEAWESSHVEAWESSHVVARGSSRVEARGFVSINAFGGTLKLSAKCHAFIRSKKAKVMGGIQTEAFIKTAKDWCDYYGVEIKMGVAVLYKALHEGFASNYDPNFKYKPGTKPEAPKFDPKTECGNGLHFSPTAKMAKYEFLNTAVKFVACPLKVSEMVVHPDGNYPSKCKAPRVYKPCWEVDIEGKKIGKKK